jgi:hypothetical protein
MKRHATIIFVFLFAGCAAEMMEKHGDTLTLMTLGKGKQDKGGVVRYLNTGLDFAKKARRKDAEKQMQTFCKGPYTIVAEGPRSKFGAGMPIGPHSSLEVDQYTYLRFECKN